MKQWLMGLFCLGVFQTGYAFELEEKMYLAEHYMSYTSSFDVSTDQRKLGTLYRRILSLNAVYDFYDYQNQPIASAQSHFFSFGAHLDVYDGNKQLLGTVEEQLLNWFPSFDIYSPDGMLLASARMNFWGTTFTLYDGHSDRVLAEMSRSFFRFRNYWTIQIKNLNRLKEKQFDPKLLLTVLAVQGDIEYLEQYRRRQRENSDYRSQSRRLTAVEAPVSDTNTIPNRYADFLKKEEALNDVVLPDDTQLNALAAQLDQDFRQSIAGITLNQNEEAEQFIQFCLNVATSSDTPPEHQKAILHLLKKKLANQADKTA